MKTSSKKKYLGFGGVKRWGFYRKLMYELKLK